MDFKGLFYAIRTQVSRKNFKGRHHAKNPWF